MDMDLTDAQPYFDRVHNLCLSDMSPKLRPKFPDYPRIDVTELNLMRSNWTLLDMKKNCLKVESCPLLLDLSLKLTWR